MRRLRTAKAVASRIDLTYFKRGHFLRRSRLLITSLCLIGVLVWWGVYASRGNRMLYNPGPIAHAHAQFEQQCSVCHDADNKGGFFKTVSDSACLRCHDGSIHSDKQKQFITLASLTTTTKPASADVETVSGEKKLPPAHPRSANCTACHIEHRGQAAIAATSDAHCVQCHGDLPAHTNGKPDADAHVVSFAAGSHPWFGRELLAPDKSLPNKSANITAQAASTAAQALRDPTLLSFNHKLHMDKEGINNRCEICHTTDTINLLGKPLTDDTSGAPPWTPQSLAEVVKEPYGLLSQGMYMRPVSYAQHCAGCHNLTVARPGGAGLTGGPEALPHERMELVRGAILALPPEKLGWLAPKPAGESKSNSGGVGQPPRRGPRRPPTPGASGMTPDGTPLRAVLLARRPPTPGSAGASETPAGGTSGAAAEERPKTADDIALESLQKMIRGLPSEGAMAERKQQITAALKELEQKYSSASTPAPATQPAGEAAWEPNPAIVRFYANYFADAQCAKCHTMQESDVKPGNGPALLVTAPTGIPAVPRHWFKHSLFDHRSHRNVTCVDCHARATTSELTSDVLSPNIAWTKADGSVESCMKCHHAPDADGRGATSNCQSCHVYHDRALEGPPLNVTTIDRIVGLSREPKHGSGSGAGKAAPATKPSSDGATAAAVP